MFKGLEEQSNAKVNSEILIPYSILLNNLESVNGQLAKNSYSIQKIEFKGDLEKLKTCPLI